jgi:hypothetical protein
MLRAVKALFLHHLNAWTHNLLELERYVAEARYVVAPVSSVLSRIRSMLRRGTAAQASRNSTRSQLPVMATSYI